MHEVVSTSDFADQARERFSLRWLALWGEAIFHDPAAVSALRAVYGDETCRERLLREDRAEVARLGLESSVAVWTRHLGLDRATERTPPFIVPSVLPRSTTTGTSDVTVLIPSYRHEAYIELAIRSVLSQTYPHFRILVADDCSPDATVKSARKVADERVDILVRRRNVGLGNNVLAALARIDTPYIAILNSDDFFHPERLARCRQALEERPDAVVAATGVALVDAQGRSLTPDSTVPLLDGLQITGWVSWYYEALQNATQARSFIGPLLQHNFLATSSNLFCRTSFLRRRAATLRGLKYCLDWQLFLDAVLEEALVYLPEELVAYRLHGHNTVWFRAEDRWSYQFEVNRVVTAGLRRLRDQIRHKQRGEDVLESILKMVVEHIAQNTEADGLTLFLHQFLRESNFERAAVRSSQVRPLLEELGRGAEERRQATDLRYTLGHDTASLVSLRHKVSYLQLLRNVGEVAEDTASHLRGVEAFLREHIDHLEVKKGELLFQVDDLQSQVAALRTELTDTQRAQQVLETEKKVLLSRLHDLHVRVASQVTELEVTKLAQQAVEREQDILYSEIRALEAQRNAVVEERDALQTTLVDEQAARVTDKRRYREELDRLYVSREWQIGNFLWNRLGLAKRARFAAHQVRRLRDRKNRYTLALARALRWPFTTRYRAVVAACWNFPIYFNTFVYQEMQALRRGRFGVKVFCWQTNSRWELHPAFRHLWRHRVVLQADWSIQQQDVAYFCRTRPQRVESLLARLAAETGRTTEALRQDVTVLMGFTFARHVELAGTHYLHSYFFYDQSFMVMMAAYLLDIPRGITAYADHMLTDYPLKCVRLHLELADIIVATSRRIRDELSVIGEGQFDDKILVKPNGIDVSRFPYLAPASRVAAEGDPELIAVNCIEPKKGLVYLAEAIRILADRGVGVRLHLVGSIDPFSAASAEYAGDLAATVQQLGIADRLVMHGVKKQPEIAALLARSCIFVAPYIEVASGDKDGIPTAILEAMSTGLPIVTTDAGSILEAVTDGVEAICVPQRDPGQLAEAIERLLCDPALCARMGEAGRRRVEREYNVDVTERRLHERIEALLDKSRR